jgi:putative transposase
MSQSLSQVLVHLIFSTKNREAWLSQEIRNELHAYIGGIVNAQNGVLLQAGSVEDHIHLLLTHPRTISPAKLVQEIKTGSSKWIKTKGVQFTKFAWQTGYGIFSISPSHQQAVVKYIENQAEHHRNNSFQDEYRNLLAKYNVPFDERYVWD